jgi:hypothetical protein
MSASSHQDHKRRGFCGHFLTIHKPESQRISHARVDCNCWSCPHCAESALRPELLAHCRNIADSQQKLFYLAIPLSDWPKTYRQLKGARYFRLTIADQAGSIGSTVHIFSARAIEGRSQQFAGLALAKLLERLIASIPHGKSPWSACRAWSIHKPRTNHGCVIIAKSRISASSLALAADRQAIPHNYHHGRLTMRCDVPTALGLLALARSIQWSQAKQGDHAANYPYVTKDAVKDNSSQQVPRATTSQPIDAVLSG